MRLATVRKPIMTENKHICDIATLGPEGTDSENAAQLIIASHNIVGKIILHESFDHARSHAIHKNSYLLIPAAYTQKDPDGKITDTWGGFHFRSNSELDLVDAIVLPLKEMCLAVNGYSKDEKSISLHPSTEPLLSGYVKELQKHYVNNKPLAAKLCNDGVTDMCIASHDVVNAMPNLIVLDRFELKMTWTLYRRK